MFWKCFWLKVRKIIILPWKNWAGKNHRKWYEDLPTRFMPYFTTSLYLGGTKILVMWYYCTLAILFKTEDKKSDTTSCDILPGQNHMKCLAFYCKLSNTIGKTLRTSHFTFKKSLEAKIRMLLFSNYIFFGWFSNTVWKRNDLCTYMWCLLLFRFEIAIFVLIFLNMVSMGIEHYNQARVVTFTLEICNALFTTIFSLGKILHRYTLRVKIQTF